MSDYGIDLKGGDDAVLLIHGLTGSPFELKLLARKLHRAGFTVKGPCLAGHGLTLDELKRTRWQDWYGTVRSSFEELKGRHRSVSVAGLCMGALLALFLAADVGEEASSLSLMSTTLFYDGWSLPWYKFLLPLAYYTPLRFVYSFEEREPYGIKNQAMRTRVVEAMQNSAVAYTSVPGQSMYELYKLIGAVKKILPAVKTPSLILHSCEDDLAGIKNALYVQKHIGSDIVRLTLLDNCYHMLPIDNQRDVVAGETADFFRRCLGRDQERDPDAGNRGVPEWSEPVPSAGLIGS
jgi:carboxylesterase